VFSGVILYNQENNINSFKNAIVNIFTSHNELTFRSLRGSLWAVILVFPMSVILGDIRYFNLKIEYMGLESFELMLFPLGLGWLVLSFLPKRNTLKTVKQKTQITISVLLPCSL
jgi:hypothetical protein